MNETIHTILSRRSIRKFKKTVVSKESIDLLLKAGMSAPSANNQQPWRFIVIDDKSTLELFSKIHSGVRFVKEAPISILLCGSPNETTLIDYWREDCSAATENILLAAHSLGLGAIWTGVSSFDHNTVTLMQDTLGIPKDIIPFCNIVIGYPDEQKPSEDRYNSTLIHYNKWSF